MYLKIYHRHQTTLVKSWGQYVLLGVNSVFALLLFIDWKHVDKLMLPYAGWYTLNALALVLLVMCMCVVCFNIS
jgi:uncharacterized membrane protein YhhN